MFRRTSKQGLVLLVVAVACLFIPLAAATNADRATQTLTVVALTCALAVEAVTWLVLRQRGYVRTAYLGAAAAAGAFSSVLLFDVIGDFAGLSRYDLGSRLLVFGAFDGLGLWLFALSLRRIFPRRVRGIAAAAIVLVLVGVFPGPSLLLQRGYELLNLQEVRQQLHAGRLYWTVGVALLVAPLLALTTLPGDWFERWWKEASTRGMAVSNRAFVISLLVGTFVFALVLTFYSFDARPTTADEIAQLWHAKILLNGRLALPPDPNPEFFAIDNIIDRPVWMSQFPIGGPAVLAIGLMFGAAWLLNPILTALIAFNVYRFVQRAYGEPQARAAAVVFAVSPMVLLMGATHMNHTPTAWLVTIALATLPLWVAATDAGRQRRYASVIGTALGVAATIRPLDGVVAAVVMGLLMLAVTARERGRGRASSLLVGAAAGVVPIALLLLANWMTTGNPLRFGYEVLWGANHSLGLHDDPTGNPHTAWRAFMLGIKYVMQVNWVATMWPVPVLLIVAGGLVLARRPNRWDVFLFGFFGAQVLLYAFYWHDGQFIGPRFLFSAIPALLILAARAPFLAAERLRGVSRRIAIAIIPVCIGVSWLRSMPPFGGQGLAREFRTTRTRLKLDPPREVTSGEIDNALIFVQEGASVRLLHRLWGLGVSRPDAARLLARADACSLLEAVRAEERRPAVDTVGRVRRIQSSIRPFEKSKANPRFADPNFHVTDTSSVTPACAAEMSHDLRLHNAIAYGPFLLQNRLDASGHVAGPAIFVIDLGERNVLLRERFGTRRWFRFEAPRSQPDTMPRLVPYGSAP